METRSGALLAWLTLHTPPIIEKIPESSAKEIHHKSVVNDSGGIGVRGGLGAAAWPLGGRAAAVIGLAVCAGVGGFGAHRGVGPVAGPWPGAGAGRWRGARRRVGAAGAGLCLGVGVVGAVP